MLESLILYALQSIFSLYLFLVFVWWWWHEGDASYIYRLTCLLMFSIFVMSSGMVLIHHDLMIDEDDLHLMSSTAWHCRQYLFLIPLVLYSGYATHRIWSQYIAKKEAQNEISR